MVLSPDGKLVFPARMRPARSAMGSVARRADGAAPRRHGWRTPPFWSPDSRFIGFFSDGKLRKSTRGGPPQVLCDAPDGRGGTWSSGGRDPLRGRAPRPDPRVSAAGGTSTAVTTPRRKDGAGRCPSFLPDGKHFIFLTIEAGDPGTDGAWRFGIPRLEGDEAFRVATNPRAYAPSGQLLFLRERTLVAQPFDAKALDRRGSARRRERRRTTSMGKRSSQSRRRDARVPEGEHGAPLLWLDRSGNEGAVVGKPADPATVALSSDDQLAYDLAIRNREVGRLGLRPRARTSTRLTFDPADDDRRPGRPTTNTFTSARQGAAATLRKASAGTGADEPLVQWTRTSSSVDWSRDGHAAPPGSLGQETGGTSVSCPFRGRKHRVPADAVQRS